MAAAVVVAYRMMASRVAEVVAFVVALAVAAALLAVVVSTSSKRTAATWALVGFSLKHKRSDASQLQIPVYQVCCPLAGPPCSKYLAAVLAPSQT